MTASRQIMGGEIVPGPPSGTKGFPIGLPGAAFPSIRSAEGIGPRVRVKGAGEAGEIDLWAVLSRNVAVRKIPVPYSSSGKQIIVEKGAGVTGVVAVTTDKEVKIRAKLYDRSSGALLSNLSKSGERIHQNRQLPKQSCGDPL